MLRRRLFNWVFYGHVWIALAATALSWLSLRITFGDQAWAPEAPVLTFIFLATLGVYTLHRYLSFQRAGERPSARRYEIVAHHPRASLFIGLSSTLFAAGLGLTFIASIWEALLWAVPLTIFYLTPPRRGWPRLRDLPYLKNIWVAWAWTIITVVVPVAVMADAIQLSYQQSGMMIISNPASYRPGYGLELISRFLFTGGIALLFDLRDVVLDRSQGVRTIANARPALHRWLVYCLLLLCATLALFGHAAYLHPPQATRALTLAYLSMLPVAYLTYRRPDENWYAVVVNGLLLWPPLLFYLASILGAAAGAGEVF